MDQNTTPTPALTQAVATPTLDSLTTLLRQSWELYIDRFLHLATVMLIPGLLGVGLMGLFGGAFLGSGPTSPVLIALVVIGAFALAILGAWAHVALAVMVSAQENVGIVDALKKSFNKIISYFWISCLAGLIVLAGTVLFILPGIFFGVAFIFTTFFLVNENMRGRDALAQSYAYVAGHWWPVFVRLIILTIIVIVVSVLTALIPGGSQGEVGSLVGNIITTPFIAAYAYVLYKNMKAIKAAPTPEFITKKKKLFTIFAVLGAIISVVLIAGLLYMAALFMVFGAQY